MLCSHFQHQLQHSQPREPTNAPVSSGTLRCTLPPGRDGAWTTALRHRQSRPRQYHCPGPSRGTTGHVDAGHCARRTRRLSQDPINRRSTGERDARQAPMSQAREVVGRTRPAVSQRDSWTRSTALRRQEIWTEGVALEGGLCGGGAQSEWRAADAFRRGGGRNLAGLGTSAAGDSAIGPIADGVVEKLCGVCCCCQGDSTAQPRPRRMQDEKAR